MKNLTIQTPEKFAKAMRNNPNELADFAEQTIKMMKKGNSNECIIYNDDNTITINLPGVYRFAFSRTSKEECNQIIDNLNAFLSIDKYIKIETKTLTQILQEECGAEYPLEDMILNLENEDIKKAVKKYRKQFR